MAKKHMDGFFKFDKKKDELNKTHEWKLSIA